MDSEKGWEEISEFQGEAFMTVTERLPVPGGWIYRTLASSKEYAVAVSTTFVPFARYIPGEHEARDKGEYDPASIRGGLGT